MSIITALFKRGKKRQHTRDDSKEYQPSTKRPRLWDGAGSLGLRFLLRRQSALTHGNQHAPGIVAGNIGSNGHEAVDANEDDGTNNQLQLDDVNAHDEGGNNRAVSIGAAVAAMADRDYQRTIPHAPRKRAARLAMGNHDDESHVQRPYTSEGNFRWSDGVGVRNEINNDAFYDSLDRYTETLTITDGSSDDDRSDSESSSSSSSSSGVESSDSSDSSDDSDDESAEDCAVLAATAEQEVVQIDSSDSDSSRSYVGNSTFDDDDEEEDDDNEVTMRIESDTAFALALQHQQEHEQSQQEKKDAELALTLQNLEYSHAKFQAILNARNNATGKKKSYNMSLAALEASYDDDEQAPAAKDSPSPPTNVQTTIASDGLPPAAPPNNVQAAVSDDGVIDDAHPMVKDPDTSDEAAEGQEGDVDDVPELEDNPIHNNVACTNPSSATRVVRRDIKSLPPAFENEEDYPVDYMMYHPIYGVKTREWLMQKEGEDEQYEPDMEVSEGIGQQSNEEEMTMTNDRHEDEDAEEAAGNSMESESIEREMEDDDDDVGEEAETATTATAAAAATPPAAAAAEKVRVGVLTFALFILC